MGGSKSLGDCDRVIECSCIGPSSASSSVIDLHGVDSTSQDVNGRHKSGHVEQSPIHFVGMGRERVSFAFGRWFARV